MLSTYEDSTSLPEDGHIPLDPLAQPVALDIEVIRRLQFQPEPVRGAEETRQTERGIGSHRPRAVHDLVDPAGRDLQALGQSVLRKLQGLEELLEQNLAGMNRRQTLTGLPTLLSDNQRSQPPGHRRPPTRNTRATGRSLECSTARPGFRPAQQNIQARGSGCRGDARENEPPQGPSEIGRASCRER